MSSIPQVIIDMLPLSAEPMSQWKKDTDIRVFADNIYAEYHEPLSGSKMYAFLKRRCGSRQKHLQRH
jgi:hypothetical protein